MKELLLDKDLRSDQEVRLFARTRTLTTLRRLKGEHIGMLFTFLQDANLNRANIEPAIIDFQNADLRRIDLHEVELRKVDLSGTDLREAKLHGATLSEADLHRADLREAQGITTEELVSQANSLEGATLPDGTLYQKVSATDLTEEVPEASVPDERGRTPGRSYHRFG